MAQCLKRLPLVNVAQVRFRPVGICGLSLLLVVAMPRGISSGF